MNTCNTQHAATVPLASATNSSLQAIRFNINEDVRVKLTARGKKCLRENYDQLAAAYSPFAFRLPDEDAEGWSRWRMWSLMQDLGSHVIMGLEPPFETEIEVLVNTTTSNTGTNAET